jgi:hypothetical protein
LVGQTPSLHGNKTRRRWIYTSGNAIEPRALKPPTHMKTLSLVGQHRSRRSAPPSVHHLTISPPSASLLMISISPAPISKPSPSHTHPMLSSNTVASHRLMTFPSVVPSSTLCARACPLPSRHMINLPSPGRAIECRPRSGR